MTAAPVWYGARGSVVLGPTEDRVARFLADRTRHGQIVMRTSELAAELGLERSEAYRITARLRVLGLFGIANDRSGLAGGRRWWRTPSLRSADALDPGRHRSAWSRVVAAARARRARLMAQLAELATHKPGALHRSAHGSAAHPADPSQLTLQLSDGSAQHPPGAVPLAAPGGSFAERMRRYGLGSLMDSWGVAS